MSGRERLEEALEAYERLPVDATDRPESWARLDALLAAVREALASPVEPSPQSGELREGIDELMREVRIALSGPSGPLWECDADKLEAVFRRLLLASPLSGDVEPRRREYTAEELEAQGRLVGNDPWDEDVPTPEVDYDLPRVIAFNRLLSMMANVYGEEGFPEAPPFVAHAMSYATRVALGIETWERQPDDGWTPREAEILALAGRDGGGLDDFGAWLDERCDRAVRDDGLGALSNALCEVRERFLASTPLPDSGRDSERLDWLERESVRRNMEGAIAWAFWDDYPTLRDAIDAAMKGGGG